MAGFRFYSLRRSFVVDSNLEGRTFGILGEPRVNVPLVNLALRSGVGSRPGPLSVQGKKDEMDQGKI